MCICVEHRRCYGKQYVNYYSLYVYCEGHPQPWPYHYIFVNNTESDMGSTGGLHRCTVRYYQVLWGTTRYYQVLSGTIRYYQVLSGTIRYYQVLSGTIRHYQVLPGTMRYYQVLWGTTRYYEVLPGFMRYYQCSIWVFKVYTRRKEKNENFFRETFFIFFYKDFGK